MTEYEVQRREICKLLGEHMGWGPLKALTWFNMNNPMLGGVSPRHMVLVGRYSKLRKWMMQQFEELGE